MEISFHGQEKPPAPPQQQGGAGGFACRSNGHNQWSASKMNKFPKTVKHPVQLRNKTVLRAVADALGLSRDKFRSATEAPVHSSIPPGQPHHSTGAGMGFAPACTRRATDRVA